MIDWLLRSLSFNAQASTTWITSPSIEISDIDTSSCKPPVLIGKGWRKVRMYINVVAGFKLCLREKGSYQWGRQSVYSSSSVRHETLVYLQDTLDKMRVWNMVFSLSLFFALYI